ncbi:MAG: barnase inhibitor [Candidatus Adlerbacteria bacterium]|nr:barnase inhibitor [Candidatus Adlerbacteria bacterium]
MDMKTVIIDAGKIVSEETLHDTFYEVFGFPDYYGRNMNAWIDCMSSLDTEMNKVQVKGGEIVTLQLDNAKDLKEKYPELYSKVVESTAFVNWRRTENGESAILALSFHI